MEVDKILKSESTIETQQTIINDELPLAEGLLVPLIGLFKMFWNRDFSANLLLAESFKKIMQADDPNQAQVLIEKYLYSSEN
jgi:hypothetical protein